MDRTTERTTSDEFPVFTYNELIAKGVSEKDIKDCCKAGFMELGYGVLESGQRIKIVRITKRGNAVQRVHPTEMKK